MSQNSYKWTVLSCMGETAACQGHSNKLKFTALPSLVPSHRFFTLPKLREVEASGTLAMRESGRGGPWPVLPDRERRWNGKFRPGAYMVLPEHQVKAWPLLPQSRKWGMCPRGRASASLSAFPLWVGPPVYSAAARYLDAWDTER